LEVREVTNIINILGVTRPCSRDLTMVEEVAVQKYTHKLLFKIQCINKFSLLMEVGRENKPHLNTTMEWVEQAIQVIHNSLWIRHPQFILQVTVLDDIMFVHYN